jgi:hypothetical protein
MEEMQIPKRLPEKRWKAEEPDRPRTEWLEKVNKDE